MKSDRLIYFLFNNDHGVCYQPNSIRRNTTGHHSKKKKIIGKFRMCIFTKFRMFQSLFLCIQLLSFFYFYFHTDVLSIVTQHSFIYIKSKNQTEYSSSIQMPHTTHSVEIYSNHIAFNIRRLWAVCVSNSQFDAAQKLLSKQFYKRGEKYYNTLDV